MERVRGATGALQRVSVHRVHLGIAGIDTTFDVDVLALHRDDGECAGLLGRDVLAHLCLAYDGARGAFSLAPSA